MPAINWKDNVMLNIFDEEIDRRHTWSAKYDCAGMFGKPEGLLPLWVADMDFRAPACVIDAVKKTAEFGVFGYSSPDESYCEAVIDWFTRRHSWTPKREWLVKTSGVVVAIAMAVQTLTREQEAVLIQPPVYYPFANAIRNNNRRLVSSPLVYRNGTYRIDFEDFEKQIVDRAVKLFILCNPHNPVCRSWTRDELRQLGSICKKHHVYVVSDEIHCDITMPGHGYTPFLVANPDMENLAVICTAPSKTFNLAGLQASNIFIPDESIRRAFTASIDRSGMGLINLMGLVACRAAYTGGEEWLEACLRYIRDNLSYVRNFLHRELPEIKLVEPEATYFAWLDCSSLGFASADALDDFITREAGLWLDAGQMFGEEAAQFQRIVLACRRELLEKAMWRLKNAVEKRKTTLFTER